MRCPAGRAVIGARSGPGLSPDPQVRARRAEPVECRAQELDRYLRPTDRVHKVTRGDYWAPGTRCCCPSAAWLPDVAVHGSARCPRPRRRCAPLRPQDRPRATSCATGLRTISPARWRQSSAALRGEPLGAGPPARPPARPPPAHAGPCLLRHSSTPSEPRAPQVQWRRSGAAGGAAVAARQLLQPARRGGAPRQGHRPVRHQVGAAAAPARRALRPPRPGRLRAPGCRHAATVRLQLQAQRAPAIMR